MNYLTLVLNTASQQNELYLLTGQDFLQKQIWQSNRDETDKLLPAIKNLLTKAEKNWSDLERLLVITGPGGFTSLRVGVSVANALIYALNLENAGLSLFDWYLQKIDPGITDFLLVHSATRREIFAQGSGALAKVWPQFDLLNFEQFKAQLAELKNVRYVGELVANQQELFDANLAQKIEFKNDFNPNFLNNLNWKKGGIIDPLYGRMGQVQG